MGAGKFFRLLNSLSIDVTLGAIGCSILASKILGVSPSPLSLFALGISIWSIYTFDHLLDANSIRHWADSHRHRIHQVYFYPILSLFLGVSFFGAISILPKLNSITVQSGALMIILVLAHWVLNQKEKGKGKWIFKELRIALIYSLGISIPSLSAAGRYSILLGLFQIAIFLIASINLFALSHIEKEFDKKQGFPNSTINLDPRSIKWRILALFSLASITIILIHWQSFGNFQISLVLTAILIGSIIPPFFTFQFRIYEAYRSIGDLSFSLSFLCLI